MVPTRRQYLTAAAGVGAGFAGCFGLGDPELIVENGMSEEITVKVDVTRLSDRRLVVNTQRTISAGDTSEFLDPFEEAGEYRVQVVGTGVDASGGERTVEVTDSDDVTWRAAVTSSGVRFSGPG